METTAESLHNISEHLKWLINSLMLLIKALITAPKKKKKRRDSSEDGDTQTRGHEFKTC